MAYSTDKPRDVLLLAGNQVKGAPPDFSQPAPVREPSYTRPASWPASAKLSGARHSEPNAPGMGTLSPHERAALLLRLEAHANAPGEPNRFAEGTVQADLVSAFSDGDRCYMLVVPAGGAPVRIDITGRIGAILAYVGSVIEKGGL